MSLPLIPSCQLIQRCIFGTAGPDYTMIIVNANAGFQRMSREHLGIALALRIPFFIVITKIDIAPQFFTCRLCL